MKNALFIVITLILCSATYAAPGGNGNGGGKGDTAALEALEMRVTSLEERLFSSDLDGDSFSPETGDCDDTNSNVSPVNVEIGDLILDGIDNDCDGFIDNLRIDSDEDGYVAETDGGNDCNDNDSTVNPGIDFSQWFADDQDHDCDGVMTARWGHAPVSGSVSPAAGGTCYFSGYGDYFIDYPQICGSEGVFTPDNSEDFFLIIPGVSNYNSCSEAAIGEGFAVLKVQECR